MSLSKRIQHVASVLLHAAKSPDDRKIKCQLKFEDKKTVPYTIRECGKNATFGLVTHEGTKARFYCGHHKLRGSVPIDEVPVEIRLDHVEKLNRKST